MGSHISAAAIEAAASAVHKVSDAGAVPMGGVVGDTGLLNEFAAMQVTAQALASVPSYPTDKFGQINTPVTNTLFTTFPSMAAATGLKYLAVVKNITGGTRPVFDLGIAFDGIKPTGDDVMTPAAMAASTCGCA